MSTITFVTPAQARMSVRIKPGTTVMEAAIANDVPGIEAQCYGAGVCGTCHVYVDDAALPLLAKPSDWEAAMLEALSLVRPCSRLSCQIPFDGRLENAEFRIPERQEPQS